jgi:hypothetical protein
MGPHCRGLSARVRSCFSARIFPLVRTWFAGTVIRARTSRHERTHLKGLPDSANFFFFSQSKEIITAGNFARPGCVLLIRRLKPERLTGLRPLAWRCPAPHAPPRRRGGLAIDGAKVLAIQHGRQGRIRSVVITRLQKINALLAYAIHQAVFLRNSARPATSEYIL